MLQRFLDHWRHELLVGRAAEDTTSLPPPEQIRRVNSAGREREGKQDVLVVRRHEPVAWGTSE